jgi:TetR/AcrR family transcriptional regulator, cholesterol catabolism regulator
MTVTAGRDRREEILVIAGRLFADQGFHGTSIRTIAEAADLQSATLYSHFKNKASMFRELIDRYFDELLPALDASSAAPEPAAERLSAMTRQSIEIGRRHRDAFIALSNDWRHIRSSDELADIVERRDAAMARWTSVLHDAVDEGAVAAEDVRHGGALWILYAAITGMVDDRYDSVTGSDHEAPVETLLRVLATGLWRGRDARA